MNTQGLLLIGAVVVGGVVFWPQIKAWMDKTIGNTKSGADITKQFGDATGATTGLGGALATGQGLQLEQYTPAEIAAAQGPAPPSVPMRPAGFRHATVKGVTPRKGQISSRFKGIKTAGSQGACQFTGPTTVCHQGPDGKSACTTFNAKSSDASSVSGRQTLCARVAAKYAAQHKGSQSLSYVGQRIGIA